MHRHSRPKRWDIIKGLNKSQPTMDAKPAAQKEEKKSEVSEVIETEVVMLNKTDTKDEQPATARPKTSSIDSTAPAAAQQLERYITQWHDLPGAVYDPSEILNNPFYSGSS